MFSNESTSLSLIIVADVYQLSDLLGVAEGEGDFRLDVGCHFPPGCYIIEQVDQHVVVLQQCDATVAVVKGHVGLDGADICVYLAWVTWRLRLKLHVVHQRDI